MTCSKCNKAIKAGSAEIEGERVCVECLISKGSKSKYGNQRTEYNGRTFDSKAEAERCAELDMLKVSGAILDYGVQPKFTLGCDLNVYRADFIVTDENGASHVEDVKGMETPKFRKDRRLWTRYGKYPLVILKRSGGAWSKEVIWPVEVDRSDYATDWHCAA